MCGSCISDTGSFFKASNEAWQLTTEILPRRFTKITQNPNEPGFGDLSKQNHESCVSLKALYI